MKTFESLDPLVQHHIVNTLGWKELRPLQEMSLDPILSNHHCLILAPTAGGKTEAAVFPLLSRICTEKWSGLSVLYICPLKALLNNLYPRLDEYCRMVGLSSAVWHGDISQSEKLRIRSSRPDFLLTTPESLEVMLISSKTESRDMLKSVRAVIVDEIHAFAGDDRGWHLLAVLERIHKLCGREIQRIGLSATVGNPESLLQWLAGFCSGEKTLVRTDPATGSLKPEVQLDYVGSLENAALVIARLHQGEKRLVFCDSRKQVEELARALKKFHIDCFLSHSSLSADQRRSAEDQFASARDCVIIATSTLELGIDVGDLDRVIQIDSPNSVASFLQRLGRTGRRSGSRANCLFLATNQTSLLKAAGILHLWKNGYVEPILPPVLPLHIFAQQLMALTLQIGRIAMNEWKLWLGRLPCFQFDDPAIPQKIIDHLLSTGILHREDNFLFMGEAGEESFGRKNFLELVSVFTSSPYFSVLHGHTDIGTIDPVNLARKDGDSYSPILLAGKSWKIEHIDWNRKHVFVSPSIQAGKSHWTGARLQIPFHIAQAILVVIKQEHMSDEWSNRAQNGIMEIQDECRFVEANSITIVPAGKLGDSQIYTFAGSIFNAALVDVFTQNGYPGAKADDFHIVVKKTCNLPDISISLLRDLTIDDLRLSFNISSDFKQFLKFHQCLPTETAIHIIRHRLLPESILREFSQLKISDSAA